MRLAFCGTPEFAIPTLKALLSAGHEVPLVLTQPDRPAGRGLVVRASAVKTAAEESGLRVLQPERLRANDELRDVLSGLDLDAIVVVAYGRLIPAWMLDLPRFGNLNLHGSLLPSYRGAAPIQWAVANGETQTGVTTMRLDAGLDTGDVLLEERVPIDPDTTASELYPRLASVGADLMVRTLQGLAAGTLQGKPQDGTRATLAPVLTRADGLVDFSRQTGKEIYARWRGFSPWPGAHTLFRGKRFLLHRMRPVVAEQASDHRKSEPGELVLQGEHLGVGAVGGTQILLEEVQLEGKARMSGADFARGFQLKPGERLG